jgi:hypothetical protein
MEHRGGFTIRISYAFTVPDEEGYPPRDHVEGMADEVAETLYSISDVHGLRVEYDDFWVE